jgi:YVTN family beta-propeller protein
VCRVVWPRARGVQRIHSLGGFQGLRRILLLECEERAFNVGLGRNPIKASGEPRKSSGQRTLAARLLAGGRAALGVSALAWGTALAGCGAYRPVVTPVTPTGPASQPQSFVMVTTTTGTTELPAAVAPGLANVFDGSGDALLTQASLGNGPISATLDATGSTAVTANSDGTLSSYNPSTTLRSNTVQSSTLSTTQQVSPFNMISTTNNLFVALPLATNSAGASTPVAAVMSSSSGVYQFAQNLSLAASPVNFAGNSNAQRIYAISQDNGSNSVTFGACDNPSAVTTPGQVASIELSTITISRTLPVGICPVYGIESTDDLRAYILNRGSGTITVINAQLNQLDNTPNIPNLNPATGALTLPPPASSTGPSFNAGPVFADYYQPTSQLVTANYDSNTISIINVSLDSYGNDSSLFGQTVTVPVGHGPSALTILRDGSRVYVANQTDSTISVVNLSTYQVEATIPVTGHPISISSIYSTPYGQVFVTAQDQPYMTVIRTDTDQVNAQIQLDGIGMDVRPSTQYAGLSSTAGSFNAANNVSHACGSGSPCDYPTSSSAPIP